MHKFWATRVFLFPKKRASQGLTVVASWANAQNDIYFTKNCQSCHFEWKYLSVAQLVTTVIFFSAWDKSRVKWDNSRNSTQKMRESSAQNDTLMLGLTVFNSDLRQALKTNLISNVQHIFTRMKLGRNKGPQTKFCAIFSLLMYITLFFHCLK